MSDDATVGLIRGLVENLKGAPKGWASLAVVLQFDAEKVNGVHGFAYSAEGVDFSVTASPYDLRSVVKEYTDTYYRPGAALPAALLIQFDRASGRYEVTFEDSDAARWKVTPANFDSIGEKLRPDFT